MEEQQISLGLDTGYQREPAAVPELRDEIAQAWGLPLGKRVEVSLRGAQRTAIAGTLELVSVPDFPWDPHQALRLRIAGFEFNSREIERWVAV